MSVRMQQHPVARVTTKGQITIPKYVRQALDLDEGDHVAFVEEDGKMVLKKAAVLVFEDFANAISQDAADRGITEEKLLTELEKVRKELWNERNQN